MSRTLLVLVAVALSLSPSLAAPAAAEGLEWWLRSGCGGACQHGKLELAERAARAARALDAETGRDLRNFPPDRLVDTIHVRLDMRFEDLSERRFTATETLRVAAIAPGVTALGLDAVGLDVRRVAVGAEPVEHYHDGHRLSLRFAEPLPPGEPVEIVIEYDCERPYDGMIFTPASPDAPHYTAEVHTQGQTEHNRHWFAIHDSPNERLTSELVVDVPEGFSVSGNGRLVSHEVADGREVWHYLQDEPHVAYLVSLVIGVFDVVPLEHPRVPMQVWVPKGMADRVERTYGRTGAMLDLFERRFGLPYPWARYDQLVVKNFGAGGMENTTATTMYPTAIYDETAMLDGDLDSLIAHELCHQWMGDLITCKSWAHIWLNEGWATLGSALWFEERDGEDGYLDYVRGRCFRVARRDRTTNELPMVSPVWENPWETFRRRANPYPKGASILHMLRRMLGEETFWAGVRLYTRRHADGLVETSDLRYAMEEVSGLGLEWFFEQWCYRPGCPELEIDARYVPGEREVRVTVEQVQEIDRRTPAFRFTLPVLVRTPAGDETLEIEVTRQTTEFRAPVAGVPSQIVVDPDLHVLKSMTVTKATGLWVEQALRGPTIAARHEALEALGGLDVPAHVELLADVVADPDERHTLRSTAAEALARLGSAEARERLLALARRGVDDARVRATLIDALDDGDWSLEEVEDVLVAAAEEDASYGVRVQAIQALAALEATGRGALLAELAHVPSQHDQVRRAALDALADLDDERGLELGIRYAAYGHMDRARPAAISALGRLAHHDVDRAVEALLALLDDPEPRSVRAAVRALAEAGDERAAAPLEAMARTHPDPAMRDLAEEQLERLREALAGDDDEAGELAGAA